MFHRRRAAAAFGAMLLAAAGVASCRRSASDNANATEPPPLEELVEYVNGLITKDPIEIDRLVRLYYPEDEAQKELLAFVRATTPLVNLDGIMRLYLGEPLFADEPDAFSSRPCLPITVTDRTDDRAYGKHVSSRGREKPVEFVKVNGVWLISARTLVMDDELRARWERAMPDGRPYREAAVEWAGRAARVAQEINLGKIETPAQAREALKK